MGICFHVTHPRGRGEEEEEEYGRRPTLEMCVGVRKGEVLEKRCTTRWDARVLADTALKRSRVEIRKKATSERARGAQERQSMK